MQEVALFPLWVTVFLTIWAPVGPLVGILVGHYLTRSWERRQWIADNQKEEYKKLLGGFNRLSFRQSTACRRSMPTFGDGSVSSPVKTWDPPMMFLLLL
jgi:hypothetical protein